MNKNFKSRERMIVVDLKNYHIVTDVLRDLGVQWTSKNTKGFELNVIQFGMTLPKFIIVESILKKKGCEYKVLE